MVNKLIIVNILAMLSNGTYVLSSFFNDKRKIIITQILECVIGAIAEFIAGGFAAASTLIIDGIRNVYCAKSTNNSKVFYWVVSIILLVAGVCVNRNGIIGMLPVLAAIQYTLWMGYCKTAQGLRWGMLINYIPWIVHDGVMGIYVSVICMSVSMVIVIINIIRYRSKCETFNLSENS